MTSIQSEFNLSQVAPLVVFASLLVGKFLGSACVIDIPGIRTLQENPTWLHSNRLSS